jgi:multiple sugar transport system substrate-binding protein
MFHNLFRHIAAAIGGGTALLSAAVCVVILFTSIEGAGAQTTLTFWTFIDPTQDNPRSRNLAGQIERFEKSNSGIKVTAEVLPWPQVASQVVQATAAGRTPDVAIILGWDLPNLVAAGSLAPLDVFTAQWSEEQRKDFLLSWDSTVWNGHKFAIPYEYRAPVLWYRQDLLDKIGASVPKSIDELVATGKKLSALPNTQGMVIGLSRAAQASAFAEWFLVMLKAGGAELVNDQGEPTFNGPAGVQALKIVKRLVDGGAMPKAVVGYTYEDVFQGVKAGTIAMTVLGSHRVKTAREEGNLGDRLRTAPVPGLKSDQPAPAHVNGWNLVIGKDSKNKEAAWKFIDFMSSPETQVITARTTGELPTRKSPYKDSFFTDAGASEVRMWKEYMERYGFSPRYPQNYVEICQLIADAVQAVVIRNVDPKVALDQAAAAAQKLR